jgi:hypothetical protein
MRRVRAGLGIELGAVSRAAANVVRRQSSPVRTGPGFPSSARYVLGLFVTSNSLNHTEALILPLLGEHRLSTAPE